MLKLSVKKNKIWVRQHDRYCDYPITPDQQRDINIWVIQTNSGKQVKRDKWIMKDSASVSLFLLRWS